MSIKSRRFELFKMKKKYFITLLSLYVLCGLGFIVEFRKVRDLFFPARIGTDYIVGFVQFYGYPPLFDFILFCVIFSIPVSFAVIVALIHKK